MTVTVSTARAELPAGAVRVAPWGLLARVGRACPDHGGECACVARKPQAGCLVYWCERGAHHFTVR